MNPETISDIFVWDTQFETGITELDRQHRRLVDLINSLGAILFTETESIEASLLRVFDELYDYVDFHFKYEEEMMQRLACSEASHKDAHDAFVKQLAESRIAANSQPIEATGKMLAFLSRWLMSHILCTDMRLAKKILAIESGASIEEAKRLADDYMNQANEALLHAMTRLYDNLATRTHELLEARRTRRLIERELQKLSSAVEHSPVSILITDVNGYFEYVNPKFTQLTGYTLHDINGKTPRILKSGKTPASEYEHLWASISSGREWHGEFHNRKKNGESYWDHASISPIFDEAGRIAHYVAIQENITERKLAEAMLQQQKQLSDDIINSLPGIFYMLDEKGRFIRINPQFTEVTGYSEKEIRRMHALDFFDGDDKKLILERIFEVFEKGDSSAEAELVSKSGDKAPYFFTGHKTVIDGKYYLVGLGTDISERLELEAELVHQARTDMLTGLPNRRHFLQLASQELARTGRYGSLLSILMIDLDQFKAINDAYGHQTGDRTLVKFAEVCRQTMRGVDITGRIGGEEFAILLPETDGNQAFEVAERLRQNISAAEIETERGEAFHFTASIGVATLSKSIDDIDKLLATADRALYEAKRAGRNRVEAIRL
ncbi:MAG: bacteriohemerythrin [Burkholderiales bacterium]|nr:bacteriohemerythrin [Burkholderiales bacterium]